MKEITAQYGRQNQHFILGDFNAKLLKSLPEEREHVGPHIFNPESQGIETLPEAQVENREMFVEFCLEDDYVVSSSSTMFQKHQEDLITFVGIRKLRLLHRRLRAPDFHKLIIF